MLNDWALPKMSVFGTKCAGHEGAGVIVKVGDHVKTLKPGMRAGYKVSGATFVMGMSSTDGYSLSKTHVVHANTAATVTSATVSEPPTQD